MQVKSIFMSHFCTALRGIRRDQKRVLMKVTNLQDKGAVSLFNDWQINFFKEDE